MYMNYVVLNLPIRKQLYNNMIDTYNYIIRKQPSSVPSEAAVLYKRLEYSKDLTDLTYGQVCIYVLYHNRSNNFMIKKIKT